MWKIWNFIFGWNYVAIARYSSVSIYRVRHIKGIAYIRVNGYDFVLKPDGYLMSWRNWMAGNQYNDEKYFPLTFSLDN